MIQTFFFWCKKKKHLQWSIEEGCVRVSLSKCSVKLVLFPPSRSPCGICGVDFTHVTSTFQVVLHVRSLSLKEQFRAVGDTRQEMLIKNGSTKKKRENDARELLKFFRHRKYHESKSKGKPNRTAPKQSK